MRLHRCSRIASRKNLRRLTAVAFLLLSAVTLPAQLSHQGNATRDGQMLAVSITVTGADRAEFFRNLDDGLSAGLEFLVRISEPRTVFRAFLGNRFLSEVTIEKSVSWDPFRQAYVVVGSDGEEQLFASGETLWEEFFHLDAYQVPLSELSVPIAGPLDNLIVEFRVSYRPLEFVPALGILSLFLSEDRDATPWTPVIVEQEGN
jgi:hypothetical protein